MCVYILIDKLTLILQLKFIFEKYFYIYYNIIEIRINCFKTFKFLT